MKKTVKFTEDFANKSKDDILVCSSMLASQLVHNDKVAKYYVEKKETAKKKPKK